MKLAERQAIGVADHGDDQAAGKRHGDAEVDPRARPDGDAVGPRVDIRELGERLRGGGQHEIGHRQVGSRGLELGTQGEEPGDVGCHGDREVRRRGPACGQPLGDHAAHPRQRPRLLFALGRRDRHRRRCGDATSCPRHDGRHGNRRGRQRGHDVALGDPPAGAGAGDRAGVDPRLRCGAAGSRADPEPAVRRG